MARASVAAFAVLVATGSMPASHDGWWDAATLHVKLALVVVAGALIVNPVIRGEARITRVIRAPLG